MTGLNLDWKLLSRLDATRALSEINPALKPNPLNPGAARVRVAVLPFYNDYRIYELTDTKSEPPMARYVLHKGGLDGTVGLDFTNRPIYHVNEMAPLNLSADTVAAYLAFFFASVHGPHGPMAVIDRLESPDPATATDEEREVLEKLRDHAPPVLTSEDANGYHLNAAMLFKDCIFKCKVTVAHNGMVQVTEHELAVGGLQPNAEDTAGTA